MVRDIRARFDEFGVRHVTVKKIALTMEQVRQYGPPPNPAKLTDPRAADFVRKFGNESWEVDALHPSALDSLISKEIGNILDRELMDDIISREEEDKFSLREFGRDY